MQELRLEQEVNTMENSEPDEGSRVIVFHEKFSCGVDCYYIDGNFEPFSGMTFDEKDVIGWCYFPTKSDIVRI